MKQLMLLNFLFVFVNSFSQKIETIHIEKTQNESDYYPQIEGVFQGEIPLMKLGSLDGLITKIGWEIVSFEINYISGRDYLSKIINSNVIPDSILVDITINSMGEQVYFTKIEAKDELNTRHILRNMTIIPIKNKDE